MNELVSIIIPNFNGRGVLGDCLKSLISQSHGNFEVILIDNGSSDDSVNFIRNNFPKTIIIQNDRNLGFARPINQGIEKARGKYVVALNNDTVLDSRCVERLLVQADKDEKVGMCAPKILSFFNKNVIDSVGIDICLDGMSRGRARLEKDTGQYDNNREILLPSGCCAFYRKEMLDEIGGFDEDFFAYCEDADLGLRGRLAGWKAIFVPGAVVYHKYSLTGGKYSAQKAFFVERNHFWLVLKNFPFELVLLFPLLTFWRFAVQFLAVILRKGAASEFVAGSSLFAAVCLIFKAYFEAFKKIPKFIKARRVVRAMKKTTRKEFYSILFKHRLGFGELVFKK